MKTRNLHMRLLSLVLCVCMVLSLMPAVAPVIEAEAASNNVTPNYITDIGIAYATRKSNAQNLVKNNGFTLIDRDLNEDAGGKYIYMGYKTSTDPSRAITGMLFRSGKNPPSTVSYGGATFYLVGGSYEGNGTGDGAVDLNDGAGGDYIYTYITRDTNYGYPILWMDVSTNVASGGFITVPNTSGSAGDVNAGTSDQSLYVYYKTFETIGGIDAYTGSDSKVYLRYRYLQTDGSTTSVTHNGQLKNHKDTYYYTPSVPQSVTWSGYSMAFAGWKYAGAIVEKPYGAYSDNSSSGTRKEYTAVYTGNVTVTYDANGGTTTPSAQTIAVTVNGKGAGDKAYFDMPTEVITNSNGCKYFLGWSSNKNAASAQYTAGQKRIEFKTDTTLYAVWENHHDGNGDMICDLCQTALSAPTTVNGIYQISNKNQLIWFMQYVNAGNKSASAVLTADIDMGGYNWTPIASTASYHESGAVVTDKGYTGTFDGAGHVIKNFTVNGGAGDGSSSASGNVKSYGLFGTVSGTVKNLGIDGFTFNVGTADCRAGAIVGQLVTGGRIEDCYVINSKVLTGSRIAGAIAGCNYGGTIDSCFAYNCEVTGHARCAAVVGDTKDDGGGKIGTVTNCYADKNPVGSQNGGSSYVTNCATLTAEQISSGEAAWMLNGNSSDGVWKQTVGSDLPSFAGGTVYQVLRCDGKTITYSNSSANPQAHTYSNINGLCTFCGAENPNVVASVFKKGSIIGVYTRLETAISMAERCVVADMAVVQLQKNVDLGGAYQKIDGGVFTIDLNGYEISSNNRARETLSIAGSGTDITIISSRTGGTVKNGSGNAIMGESSTNLTVTGIRVIAAQNGMRLYGNATLRDLTVESMNAEGYGISVQGADLTLTLTNCTVTAAKAALYITGSSSTVIVNGGSFNGDSADFINLGKVVLGEGTIFPGGISVDYATLKAILGEGMAYWQGDKMIIPAEGATQITGGDVVIKAECMHPGDKTYTNNVGDHSWSCEDCNNTFTEAHSYTNCVCVCGAVSPDAEASVTIGGKASYYATLNDAIAVAQNCSAADQAVVTILKDIDLGDDYQRINGGVFTFDLNGFELSSQEDYWGVFVLRNGADITIIDSRGDGKITGVFYGIEAHDSTVTISGGTISGQDCGVYVTGCTVTISGGTISGQTYGVYAYNNSDVTISGGTIIGKGYDLRAYKSSVFKLTVGENGVGATFPGGIKVYGTTLNAILGEGMAYWQGNKMITPADKATQITGGDVVIKAECMHPGDKTYTNNVGDHSWNCEDCNNTFTEAHSYTNCVCVCGAVSPDAEASVTIGGEVSYYATLDDAIQAVKNCTAADQAVVTILKDIDLGDDYQEIYGSVFTFDLNGFEVSSSNSGWGVLVPDYGADITIIDSGEGGKITGAGYGIEAYDSTVTIIGGTISGQLHGVYACDSTVTISGGTISAETYDLYGGNITLTVGEDGVGAAFPGGLWVGGTTLNAILGEGTAYWQNGKQLSVTGNAFKIQGGDVVIKAECKHPGDKTYTDNGDDHTYTYTCCGLSATEVHTFVNGQCICGKLEHKHNWSYQDNGDGTHTESCTCDYFVVEHVYENGVCICGALPAASVTMDGVTMYFRDLDSAIQEARFSTSKTTVVKLLQDIDLGDGYQEIHGSVFTFDLNGFELSSLDDFWGVLVLRDGADITIIDSREGGKITSAGYSIEAYGSTVTISGGTISGQSYGVYAYNNSDVTISGGTIIGKTFDLGAYKSGVFKLTVGENGVGATFPGGIKVYGTTLNAILDEGAAYWQGNKMIILAEGATEITGGDVVIKAPCTHSSDYIDFELYSNEFHKKTCGCGFINELEEHRFGSDFVCDDCGYDKNVIIITMMDDWGDGWNDNGIYVYKDGVLIGTATIKTGRTDIWSCPYDPDAEYEFYWQRGGYPEECSFEISIAGETVKKVASRGCSNYREGQLLYPLPLYSGWTELDGKWYYYDLESHEPVTGVVRVPYPTEPINGITYGPNPEDVAYFESKGQTFVNKDTGWFWFNYDGSFNYYQNGVWHHDVGNHSGSVLVVNGMIPWHVGMVAALGGYYYFIGDETNGANKYAVGDVYMSRNTTDRDFVIGGVYTFDEYGALCEYNGITEVNGVLRYYEDARLMLGNGLTKVGENYIYVRSNGELVVDAEYYILPNDLGIAPGTYTFDENGFMVEPISSEKNGVYFENGSWYYYDNGKIGYNKGLIHVSTNWHFEDGSVMGYTAFIYVRSSGKLATGDYYVTNVSNGYGLFSAGQKVNFSEDGMAAAPKNGIYEIDGVLYYFVNNQIQYNAGLVEYNGGWIYVRSNGALATGKYWITNTGGAMEAGYYEFGDDGYLIISDTEDGIVFEGENLYYYLDGKKQFGLGLTKLEDGTYIYVRTNGELAVGSYWITNHNGLLPEGMYEFGEDGILTEN